MRTSAKREEEAMVATHRVNLPVAKGVTVETSPDGKQTALLFKTSTEPGFVGIALNNAELARMVSMLLSQAAKVAAKVVPVSPPTKMTATPILASHLGFAKGRSDSEAIVAFRVGNLDLTFAVDVSILHGQCTTLLSTTGKTARRKPS
jgi:hypothetical protein